jgi:hypothetical protein
MKKKQIRTFQMRAKVDQDAYDLVLSPVSRNSYGRQLSPFHLGPVKVDSKSSSVTMENAWQYSKVFPQLGHLTETGDITEEWYRWRETGFASARAHRHPAGRGQAPAFSFYRGRRFGYIASRKLLYIPMYAKLACKTDLFKELQDMYESGARLAIKDFDCYDHVSMGMSTSDVIHSKHKIMGHGFVLKMMLEEGPDFYKKLVV